jgi:opacity protein-like surface antigen
VYPLTANFVARAPDALFRPYASIGGGLYGWDSRIVTPTGARELITGWDPGWTAAAGLEYYLRANIAFDVSLRYHATRGPGPRIGLSDERLRFWAVWIGHYVRF